MAVSPDAPIGVMGIGRIGKLLVWPYAAKKQHKEIVIATGRKTGTSLDDLATYFGYDSTYGTFDAFIGGFSGKNAVTVKDGHVYLNGVKLIWLNEPEFRVPGNIPWNKYGVDVVFDTTGRVGVQTQHVFVRTNDPASPVTQLEIRGEVGPPISTSPGEVPR